MLLSKSVPLKMVVVPLGALRTFSAWSFLMRMMALSSIACVHSGASKRSAVLAAAKRRS
jgi:hypothetical protein